MPPHGQPQHGGPLHKRINLSTKFQAIRYRNEILNIRNWGFT